MPRSNFKDPNSGILIKVKMAAHALYSPAARRAMRRCLADFSPDLAHVRGIYHHLSPSILWELKRQGAPVLDRKTTRLNSSHTSTSYPFFSFNKKNFILTTAPTSPQSLCHL